MIQPTMYARCGKNVAVIFITKVENNETTNQGLCLSCAREMRIKPVDELLTRMGLTETDLENLANDMTGMLSMDGGIVPFPEPPEEDLEEDEDAGKTATFPFLSRLFGNFTVLTFAGADGIVRPSSSYHRKTAKKRRVPLWKPLQRIPAAEKG